MRLGIEGAERLQDGTVVGLEYVEPVLRRAVAKYEVAPLELDRRSLCAKPFGDVRTGSYDAVWWLSVLFGVLSAVVNLPIVEKPLVRAAAVPA